MEMRANTLEKGKIGQKASSKETKKKIENCRVERSSTLFISKQNLRKKETRCRERGGECGHLPCLAGGRRWQLAGRREEDEDEGAEQSANDKGGVLCYV